MPKITTLLWDIGGVLLSNAWDHTERARALTQFQLDDAEFNDRHQMVVSSFERGKISLDEYLDRTIFYRPRTFSREAFREYMFSLSTANEDVLNVARSLAASHNYLMATLNNESKELNAYRIQKFGLRDIFTVFVSSCSVGMRKPEAGIYQMALDLTQKVAEECCFIDDRPLNLESASRLGMHVIQMKDVAQLVSELTQLGVMT